MKSLHILVSGRVQGVAFRHFARGMARSLGVRGFVRNLSDGRVEVLAQGADDALAHLVRSLEEGPPMAVVGRVETRWTDEPDRYPDFTVRRAENIGE